jgi:SulP family sulfate permease
MFLPEGTQRITNRNNLRPLLPTLSAGLVNGILIVIFQSAYAALIFSGKLSGHVAQGIGIMLFGAFIMGVVMALSSSFPGTTAAPQDAPAAIFALIAAAIAGGMAASAGNTFITVVAAIALTTIFTGGLFLALGGFRLGNLVRFIPYPVVGGFLAGTGWLLLKGAVGIMSGVPLDFSNLSRLFQPDILLNWLPGFFFGLILYLVLRRFRHFLLMPGMIIGGIGLFYLLLFLTGTSVAEAGNRGLLLSQFPGGVGWHPLTPSLLSEVNWPAIFARGGNLSTIAIIALISLLLNASGLELIARREVDLNRELRAAGIANLLAGLGGSSVGYMSLSLTALGYRMGSRSRLSSLTSAALCGLTLLSGAAVAAYFPKPLLGGLLLYLGITFLMEWVYKSWFRLPRPEYLLVLLILVIIGFVGFLEGVAIGVLIAVVLFVINYSRIDVVKHVLTGVTFQSNVDREPSCQRFLREKGEQLYIYKLQGFIFFGTANNLLDQINKRVSDPGLPPLRLVVLDFRLVSGIDSSAMNSFLKMKLLQETREITLVFTHLSPHIRRQFKTGGLIKEHDTALKIFPDLDHGVEWCEDQILQNEQISGAIPPGQKQGMEFLESVITAFLKPHLPGETGDPVIARIHRYLERKKVAAGVYLIRQGNPPVGIYFIESGQFTARLTAEDGKTVRLRSMGPGTVVGEMGVYLGLPATASVVTDRECVVLFLSFANLLRMERADPETAAAFHKFIACVLGERLANNNKTIRALMD